MVIQKAVIHYDQELNVYIDDHAMLIKRVADEHAAGQSITIGSDELGELLALAKLLNWEL